MTRQVGTPDITFLGKIAADSNPRSATLLACVVAFTVVVGLVAVGRAGAASDPVVWVNDPVYGSAGMGFYHDFVSGQVWTAERDWHSFSPSPPRVAAPLWVNYLTYGSAGGGFYLDPVSGTVWTAERDWHGFDPRPAAVATTIVSSAFCRTAITCGTAEPLLGGQPIRARFQLSQVPTQAVFAQAYWNGTYFQGVTWPPPPYPTASFNVGDVLGIAPAAGTVDLRVFVGGTLIGAFSAKVTSTAPVPPPPTVPAPSVGCVARVETDDWELCVREAYADLFEIRVTPLSVYAASSPFRVRVWAPDGYTDDSLTKYPLYVGHRFDLSYPSDFAYLRETPPGEYEIQIRIGFTVEARVHVNVLEE